MIHVPHDVFGKRKGSKNLEDTGIFVENAVRDPARKVVYVDESGKTVSDPHSASAGGGNSFFSFVLELLKIAVICTAIILPIRLYVMQPFSVKGSSMEPNFSTGEYLIVDELTYRFRPPRRGEIVVFRYKLNKQFFIKRVIASPGEGVKIEDNRVLIYNKDHLNGTQISEIEYLPATTFTSGGPDNAPLEVGDRQLFVLGDNRAASMDSRSAMVGLISFDDVVGRALFRGYPFDKIGFIKNPLYQER